MVIKKNDKLELHFDSDIDTEVEIKERILRAYEKNRLFFGCSLKNQHAVHLIYKREEMDNILKMKTEPWLVGATTKDGTINIFSPKVFSKVSSHTDPNFDPVLTHELAHVFTNEFFNFSQPIWLREGIAGYVAKQHKNKKPKKISDFKKLHNEEDWNKEPNYTQSFCFVAFLVERFEKNEFLQFLKILSKENNTAQNFTDFSKSFVDYFGISFNQTVLEWQKKLPQ
jgi:hypothetical protein